MGDETRSRTRAGKHATLGWFSPPHFSRDVARCGHPLRLRCRRSASLSRVVSSVAAPCGASERRACIATGDARATRAVGGSRRRNRAGPFARAAVVFFSCSSPVRSPVVVLVSRLLYGRRSVRSEGAAHGGQRGTRARRARRARVAVGGSRRRSRAGPFARAAVVVFFSCSSPVRSPVVVLVLVSRLLYGRRSVWLRGRGGRRATGDARATRAVGGSRRRSRAEPFAHAAVVFLLLLLFARLVAGRRPRLTPSLRPPIRAERGRGGRRGTSARRARRACVAVGGSRRRSRAGPFARAAVVSSSLALLPSRPSLRARAAPSLRARGPAGGARTMSGRRGRALSASRRARRAGSPSAVRPRSSRPAVSRVRAPGVFLCFWASLLFSSPRSARAAISLRTQRVGRKSASATNEVHEPCDGILSVHAAWGV